jgi:hypothetical protein
MTAATLVFRPAVRPAHAVFNASATDFVRLFALDRLHARSRLICHWQRDAQGRLAGAWEPDLAALPRR